MKKYKFTIIFGLFLMLPALSLVLIYHIWQTQQVVKTTYRIMLKINYLGSVFSSWVTDAVFKSGVAPSAIEVVFFEIMFVFTALLQGCLIGALIDWVWRIFKKR